MVRPAHDVAIEHSRRFALSRAARAHHHPVHLALAAVGFLLWFAALALADGIHVSLEANHAQVNPGDTLAVSLTVFQADAQFNAFDAFIRFDPERFQFVPRANSGLQIGPLLEADCANFFHLFTPHADVLEVHLSLLCAATFVTGPGVLYRVWFRALPFAGPSQIECAGGTDFFDAGYLVTPMELVPLSVTIATTDVMNPDSGGRGGLVLEAPRPNPLRGAGPLHLEFSTPTPGRVGFEILDPQGRRWAARSVTSLGAARQVLNWSGLRLVPGRYVVRMSSATGVHADRGWVVIR